MRTLTLSAYLLCSSALAAELKPVQEEAKEAFDKQMKSILDEVNTECGTRFAQVASDFENYDKKNFPQMPPGQTCSQLTYAFKQICKSGPYRKALAAKVKGVACLTTPKEPAFALHEGVFTFHMGPKGTGLKAVEALKAELDK